MEKIKITDLLEAGVHFGHQTKRWNPKMKPYIYGRRNGITIFDLTITMRQLAEACAFLRDTVAGGGRILFVGAKRQAQETVREVAEECGMFYMCDRWLGGTLTNHTIVLSRVARMKKLQTMETTGEINALPKKEIASLRRERTKLERTLGGIAEMRKLPAALVVIDIGREDIAVKEANKLGIPVVGLTDSNSNPDPIEYVIPGNDDALRSLKVIIGALTAAVKEGLGLAGKDVEVKPKAEAKPEAKPE
ncbi:MAG: 30S ribosomal protein S2, partial [Lentisphaeria bacterium]|nr:30S ribosomal protein S2 [Lentisphaeria bacterium]